MEWLLTAVGLVLLLLAGDALVKGAVNLALRVGIPPLIVSLTIVGFGTSAPELLISIQAILDGLPSIAVGNVVGSNTANILLVLGIPALIAVMHTSEHDTRSSYLQMIAATVLFIGLCAFGKLTWVSGIVLLLALGAMLAHAMVSIARHRACEEEEEEDIEGADPNMSWAKIGFFIAIGLFGLPVGANLLIDGASSIARAFNISEAVIGLTLVAVGTSLPELATTVMAALRRQADVALGNVIGSNMFNLLGIMGAASLVDDIPIAREFLTFDLWVMLGASLLILPFVFFKKDIGRATGIGLSFAYVAYVVMLLN